MLEGVWIGSDEGVSSVVRGSTTPGGLYNMVALLVERRSCDG